MRAVTNSLKRGAAVPYDIKEIGRPISLTIGTPALVIRDITDWEYTDGKEGKFKASGNRKYERHCIGKFQDTLTIKTTDASLAVGGLKKMATVAGVVFLAEAPIVGDAGGDTNEIGLQHEDNFRVSMSYCVVEECGPISGNAEGDPVEYEIKLRAVRKPDGTDPDVDAELVSSP
jgi:hypothetical protein